MIVVSDSLLVDGLKQPMDYLLNNPLDVCELPRNISEYEDSLNLLREYFGYSNVFVNIEGSDKQYVLYGEGKLPLALLGLTYDLGAPRVDIVVHGDKLGEGYGFELLSTITELLPCAYAYISKDHLASRKLFERAGYSLHTIDGRRIPRPYVVYLPDYDGYSNQCLVYTKNMVFDLSL